MRRLPIVASVCVLVAAALLVPAGSAGAIQRRGYGFRSWLRGDPANVDVTTTFGAMLEGGAFDRRSAWSWFLGRAGYGDIVVICSTCSDEYDPFVLRTHAVDSVQTLRLTKRAASDDPFVVRSVEGADGIFFAGGDQSDYVRIWKDTPVAGAVNDVIARGGAVGGISAGLAILGEFLFAAEKNTITSAKALADCYDRKITLERDMVDVPPLASTITDSHFTQRDRLGRLLTFEARTITDGWTDDVRGIGVDEATALLVDADGGSTVLGPGTVSFVRLRTADVLTCERHAPLETAEVTVEVVARGGTFDLASWSAGPGAAEVTVRAHDGSLIRS